VRRPFARHAKRWALVAPRSRRLWRRVLIPATPLISAHSEVSFCDLQNVWYRRLLLPSDIVRPSGLTVAKRNLRVTKWLGTVPAVGICTSCNREFKVPLTAMKRVSDAQENLRIQFTGHKCIGGAAETLSSH
jgi:hypothetical protein